MSCSGCEWLMVGRYAPWCAKAHKPLLLVTECPCPHETEYFEPLDVMALVDRARLKGRASADCDGRSFL